MAGFRISLMGINIEELATELSLSLRSDLVQYFQKMNEFTLPPDALRLIFQIILKMEPDRKTIDLGLFLKYHHIFHQVYLLYERNGGPVIAAKSVIRQRFQRAQRYFRDIAAKTRPDLPFEMTGLNQFYLDYCPDDPEISCARFTECVQKFENLLGGKEKIDQYCDSPAKPS
jgi:hypothetical protein